MSAVVFATCFACTALGDGLPAYAIEKMDGLSKLILLFWKRHEDSAKKLLDVVVSIVVRSFVKSRIFHG
jgi:hypothetical protein